MFTSPPALIYLRRTGRVVNAETAKDALSCLHRFSLVTYDPDDHDHTVRIHPLVQRAVRETLTRRGIARTARAAANALSQAWPETEHDNAWTAVLRDNVAALRKTAGAHLWCRRAQAVLFRAGHSLGESGEAAAARDYFQELVDSAREELGHRNPTTLRARAGLAHWQGEAGDPTGAAATLTEVLRDARRTFSRRHPFMLKARRSHARWRTDAGEPVSATAFTELLDDVRRVFGPEHPKTLRTMNNLAQCQAGDTP